MAPIVDLSPDVVAEVIRLDDAKRAKRTAMVSGLRLSVEYHSAGCTLPTGDEIAADSSLGGSILFPPQNPLTDRAAHLCHGKQKP